MMRVIFQNPVSAAEINLKYAVIAARYRDKWVFCWVPQKSVSFKEYRKSFPSHT